MMLMISAAHSFDAKIISLRAVADHSQYRRALHHRCENDALILSLAVMMSYFMSVGRKSALSKVLDALTLISLFVARMNTLYRHIFVVTQKQNTEYWTAENADLQSKPYQSTKHAHGRSAGRKKEADGTQGPEGGEELNCTSNACTHLSSFLFAHKYIYIYTV